MCVRVCVSAAISKVHFATHQGGYPARFHLQHEVASRMMKMGSLGCTVHEADPTDLTSWRCKASHLDFLRP